MNLQERVFKTKEYLMKNYEIKNNEDLKNAMTKLPKLNIGIFVSPIRGN